MNNIFYNITSANLSWSALTYNSHYSSTRHSNRITYSMFHILFMYNTSLNQTRKEMSTFLMSLHQLPEGCSFMREIAKKLKISYNGVYYSLHRTAQTGSNQNRKRSGRPQCTAKQEDKYIWVSSLRNRHLTGPQLAASLNGTHKTQNVHSEEATPGCWPSRQSGKEKVWDWPIKWKD